MIVDGQGRVQFLLQDTQYRTGPSRGLCVERTARMLHNGILRLSKLRKRRPNWIKVVNPPTCSALGSRVGACGNPKVQLTSPCPSSPIQGRRFLYKRYRPRSHPYSPSPSVKRSVLAPNHPPRSQCCLPDRARHENTAEQAKSSASSSLDIHGGGGSSIARTLVHQLCYPGSNLVENSSAGIIYASQNISSPSAIPLATLTVVKTKKIAAALEQHFFLCCKLRKTIPAALLHHLRLFHRPHTDEGQWE